MPAAVPSGSAEHNTMTDDRSERPEYLAAALVAFLFILAGMAFLWWVGPPTPM
jgi:hypothetical protein